MKQTLLQRILARTKIQTPLVELSHEALIKAITYAGIVATTHNGSEFGGLLYGRREADKMVIVDIAVGKTYATGGFTETDEPIHKYFAEAKARGLEVLGPWHSHPFSMRSPSGHEDVPTLKTWEKMLKKTPLMLIVASNGYWLGCSVRQHVAEVKSYIPQKNDPLYNIDFSEIEFSREARPDVFDGITYQHPANNYYGDYGDSSLGVMDFFEWVAEQRMKVTDEIKAILNEVVDIIVWPYMMVEKLFKSKNGGKK